MKNLKQYIEEKLIINNNYKNTYLHEPTTSEELREIIIKRYIKQGSGTKDEPIDFNDIDVSRMTSFYDDKEQVGIFEGTNFEYIDVSDWDVSNVINMHAAFWGCEHLKSIIGISEWDVSNVEDMWHMFGNSPITNIPDWYRYKT